MTKFIFDGIFSLLTAYDKGKKQLFDQHVEPLMKFMNEVHADYISAFEKVRSSLVKREVPASELIEFLKMRRQQLAAQRKLTETLADELSKADRRPVRNNVWTEVKNFSDAIVFYFDASEAVAAASWYTDFIRFMEASKLMGIEQTFFDKNVFGNDPRVDLISHIENLLDHRLPDRLHGVQTAYAKLRTALL